MCIFALVEGQNRRQVLRLSTPSQPFYINKIFKLTVILSNKKMETLKVIKVLQMQQGTSERGQWKSQDIVVEAQQNVQYPDRYVLHFSGQAVDQLAGIREGMVVTAQWAASVREWKTKDGREMYSQEMKCWKIEPVAISN